MFNEKFQKFYEELSVKIGKTVEQMIVEDGYIVDPANVKEDAKKCVDVMNCYENPFFFLDKLRLRKAGATEAEPLPINIGTYLMVRYLEKEKNVLLDLPPMSGKTIFISAYGLYKILFNKQLDDRCLIIAAAHEEDFEFKLEIIKELYDNLPGHLQIFTWDYVLSKIARLKEDSLHIDEALLVIYDDKIPVANINDQLLSVVSARGAYSLEARTLLNKLTKPNFIEVKYNFIDVGRTYGWAEDMFKIYNNNIESFLREICQLY